jgi:osmotically-inducible protein OsmY
VIILGVSPLSSRLTRAFRELGAQCKRVGSPEEADFAIDSQAKALLIVPPIPRFSVLAYVRRGRASSAKVPVFVVMEGPLPRRTTGTLYGEGVEAIFTWPGDAQALKRTVFRICAANFGDWRARNRKTASEVALEETVRAHLRAHAAPFGAHLAVEARGRFIVLRGSLDGLWKLELARQIATEVAGVEDVVAEGVEITGPARDDREVAAAVRQVLRHASDTDASTLALSVRSGEVTITGSVRDKLEASRALELIEQVRGVRRVNDYLVISPKAKNADKALARRVRHAMKTKYPDARVDVAVFGSVAVVSGRVGRASVREAMKKLIYRQEGVERVVDKLSVSRRAPR